MRYIYMNYISHLDNYHQVRLIPRADLQPNKVIITHELSDTTTILEDFDYINKSGFLQISFFFTAKETAQYRIEVYSDDKLIYLGKIETL